MSATLPGPGDANVAATIPLLRGRYPGELLIALTRDRLGFLRRVIALSPDAAGFRIGPQLFVVLMHPDAIRDVLITNKRHFIKGRALERSKRLLGNGLLTSEGDFHLRQRRLAQPAFHRDRIAAYAETMIAYADRAASGWRDGDAVDVWREMVALTLTIAGKTMFGADVDDDAGDVRAALSEVLAVFDIAILPFAELMDHLPLPWTLRFNRARARLDAIIYRIIAERRASAARGGVEGGDLLSMLIDATDVETGGGGMSDEQLRDEMMTLFLAGHETTANALTFTWALLARYPDVERRMHAELDAVLEGGRAPRPSDLPRLDLTRRLFAESLRLYPPAWTLGYRAVAAVEAGGWRIPSRALVLMPQIVVHRDRRWWPEPDRFDPDRWLPERSADRPRFAYFPFGGGVRQCIGEHFAWAEGVLVLATIARRWRLSLPSDASFSIIASFTLRPGGLQNMTVTGWQV